MTVDEPIGRSPAPSPVQEQSPLPARSKTRRWFIRTLALALGLVLGCGIAEIGLRLFGQDLFRVGAKTYLVSEATNVNYHCYPDNYSGDLKLVPDVTQGPWRLYDSALPPNELPLEAINDTPWCAEYRMSPQKLRDRTYPPTPPPGVLRVLGIGDSFAMGVGVPVERSLFRQLNALAGLDVEIINAARSGSYLPNGYAQVERLAEPLNCSRVLIIFIPNDMPPSKTQGEEESLINDLINVRESYLDSELASNWLTRHSKLLELIQRVWTTRQVHSKTLEWYLDCYDEEKNPEGNVVMQAIFKHFSEMPNAEVAMVIYPLMEGLDGDYPLAPIHQKVDQLATQLGIPVLDLAPAFAGQDPRELWVHPCDHHPNSKAHAIAANAIYQWLTTEVPWFLDPKQAVPAQ